MAMTMKYRLELINNPHSPFEQRALELDLSLPEQEAKMCATFLGKSMVNSTGFNLGDCKTSNWENKDFGFVRWIGSLCIQLREVPDETETDPDKATVGEQGMEGAAV